MKILRIATCILFVFISYKSHNYVTYGIRPNRIKFYRKYSFLDPNHIRKCKNIINENNVYNNYKDSLKYLRPLYSCYSDYLKENQVKESNSKPNSLLNILSIETSYDDTCVAVVRSDGNILSEGRSYQRNIIEQYGGLKPASSRMAHEEEIESLTNKVIKDSGLRFEDIDEIAVTRGPGTELCLRVGYNFAKELSKKYNIPLVSENHIAAHCLSPLIKGHQYKYTASGKLIKSDDLKYPYICLLLSGGHSQIYVVENATTFHLICDTQDEYSGNVLDKCAKELGLPVTGGAASHLEKVAGEVQSSSYKFTVPNKNSYYLQFCFSGIQSQLTQAINNALKKNDVTKVESLPKKTIRELAFAAQSTVFQNILTQLSMAMDICEKFFPTNQLAIVGGVACNKKIKNMILDLFYERDQSQLFSRQTTFFRRIKVMIKRFLQDKNEYISQDNPYLSHFQIFREKLKNLNEFVHYLWNPELFPEVLLPGYIPKTGSRHKNELYNSMLNLFFQLIGRPGCRKIRWEIDNSTRNFYLVNPSKKILRLLESDPISPFNLEFGRGEMNNRWELYSTEPTYSTDNAVMIGFSLIEKHKTGITGIKNFDTFNGKDVIPRWDLGKRRNWELISDISILHSLLNH